MYETPEMTVMFIADGFYNSERLGKTCSRKMYEKINEAIETGDFSNIEVKFMKDGIIIRDCENPEECYMKSFFPEKYEYENLLTEYGNELFDFDEYKVDSDVFCGETEYVDGVRIEGAPDDDPYGRYMGCAVQQTLVDCIEAFGMDKVLERVSDRFCFETIDIRAEIVDPTDRFRRFIALDFID